METPDGETDVPLYLRASLAGLALAVPWGALVGLLLTCQYASGLQPFGADRYAHLLVTLALLRAVGPQAALVAVALAASVVFHRDGRHHPDRTLGNGLAALLLGVTVPLAYPLVTLAGIAACTTWMRWIGEAVPFLDGVRDSTDVAFGLGQSVALGVVAVPAFAWAAPRWRSPMATLGRKLLATWAVLLASSCVTGTIASAIGAWITGAPGPGAAAGG